MGIKGGSGKGLSRSAKRINTRAKHGGEANSIARRGVQRVEDPLAGSRGSAPCGVWGNAPTVPRPTNSKEAANKGAGSEASLPVTSRSRRSAPKPLYPLLAHCRAKWARPHSRSTTPCPCFPPSKRIPNPKRYKKNQRHKTAGFFNLQKYSLLQLRQMNPQEHQHVRHKLARRGARFMRRGIPPR